jgi:hypothetical protein
MEHEDAIREYPTPPQIENSKSRQKQHTHLEYRVSVIGIENR